jgi:hypothetical protein
MPPGQPFLKFELGGTLLRKQYIHKAKSKQKETDKKYIPPNPPPSAC